MTYYNTLDDNCIHKTTDEKISGTWIYSNIYEMLEKLKTNQYSSIFRIADRPVLSEPKGMRSLPFWIGINESLKCVKMWGLMPSSVHMLMPVRGTGTTFDR